MHELRKAVLLAAGRGTRLGELTRAMPKPLLDIAGKPILERIIRGISSAGIREFVIVTGYLSDQIEDFCIKISRERQELKVETVRQNTLDGTGGALRLARDFGSAESAFMVGWGDVLVDEKSYRQFVERARAIDCDLLLAVNRVEDPFAGAAMYIDQEDRVTRIIEKPPKGSSTTNWNNAGLFAATPEIFEYVEKLEPSSRGELELPAAMAAMIEDGARVFSHRLSGFWSDIGTPQDLAMARRYFGS